MIKNYNFDIIFIMKVFKLIKETNLYLNYLDIDIDEMTINDLYNLSSTVVNFDDTMRKYIKENKYIDEVKKHTNINLQNARLILDNLNIIDLEQTSNNLKTQSIIFKNLNIIFSSPLNNIKTNIKLDKNIVEENEYIKELAERYDYDKFKIANYLVNNHNAFTKFIAYELEGNYIETPFDDVFNQTIDKVFKGEIKKLIINIPMGYGKTFRGVIISSLRAYAIESRSKILHISYNDSLVKLNSSIIRDIIINSALYKELFGINIIDDTNTKAIWKTNQGGIFKASASGAGITGFRAGNINISGFSGFMVIDDPLKPDDALSNTKREFINNRFENVFKSRIATEDIPIIVIMQRLHIKDFTNHLLTKYPNQWYLLKIPALIDEVKINKYAKKTISLNKDLNIVVNNENGETNKNKKPISSWNIRYSLKYLLEERVNNPHYFYSQLQQDPILDSKSKLLRGNWLVEIKDTPKYFIKLKQVVLFADTANKTKTYNDYTVFLIVGVTEDNKLFLIDLFREKVEFYNLILNFKLIWNKWTFNELNNKGLYPKLSLAYVEDKASGTSLIQMLRREGFNIVDIQRNKDKVYRVSNVSHLIKQGYITYHTDDNKTFIPTVKKEMNEFTINDTHEHDDIIDTLVDAVNYLIVPILNNSNKKEMLNLVNKLPI